MKNAILSTSPLATRRADLERRIAALRSGAQDATDDAYERYALLDGDFQALADEARARLLGTALAWSDEDRREIAWLRHANDDLARAGHALCQALGEQHRCGDGRTMQAMARTLLNIGTVVKWEVVVTRQTRLDVRRLHLLMQSAMDAGVHKQAVRARHDGVEVECTLESLYFRVLLLARFASGALNMKQIEILDAWMWLWMPVLEGVSQLPSQAALRADLDSNDGLRRGPRPDPGPCLYLPPAPIGAAYREIIREFHAGRLVPSEGLTTQFRIEEHVAVLDLIRRGLRESTSAYVERAERRESALTVELFVGLAEVMGRGFSPAAPTAPALSLVARDGQCVDPFRGQRDRDVEGDEMYERRRRTVRVANVSETGFGIEGEDRDCGTIAVGDIVALRLGPERPLEICKVVRSLPAATPGRVWIGVRRLSARARPLQVAEPAVRSAAQRESVIAFVPGEDESGRHDACLVTERAFAEGAELQAYVGDCLYSFRFNRPRDRGRGWVLAGFEILAASSGNGYAVG